MVEMELNKIIIDEKRHDQLIVLKEKGGNRLLPIVIGLNEASAIKLKISGFNPPRPLTHDLLFSIIRDLEASIDKVIIDKLEENTFHAKLAIKTKDGGIIVIDARPSDSIALAVRAHVPIIVEDSIMNKLETLDNPDMDQKDK
ncbi:MAG: bifunctional nuclease family protein [Candidatus Omnitrophota bacterium]|nr:bifunctional nuclease family protein [Candidatus Omnitrophota bacterium]MBU1929339.1 bifunctional nuclease family protein [Candidatus Omnitrophota bacterium]MBU2035631.1 bifunctional nuclease family protein [Candidatus Omnitrophota bacterium]MBU2257633.1 bifunctional nuclease family protein [Candidatus Omnitrophota bacterium]